MFRKKYQFITILTVFISIFTLPINANKINIPECQADYIWVTKLASCIKSCPKGEAIILKDSYAICAPCPEGSISDGTTTTCTSCSMGSWSNNIQDKCIDIIQDLKYTEDTLMSIPEISQNGEIILPNGCYKISVIGGVDSNQLKQQTTATSLTTAGNGFIDINGNWISSDETEYSHSYICKDSNISITYAVENKSIIEDDGEEVFEEDLEDYQNISKQPLKSYNNYIKVYKGIE